MGIRLQLTPDNSGLQVKSEKVPVIGSSSDGEGGGRIPAVTGLLQVFSQEELFCCVTERQRNWGRTIGHFKKYMLLIFILKFYLK